MRRRLVLLTLLVFLIPATAASSHITFPDNSTSYDEDEVYLIYCDKTGGNCPTNYNVRVELCGAEQRPDIQDRDNEVRYASGYNVPITAECDLGDNSYAFSLLDDGDEIDRGGSLRVGFTEPGYNLNVKMNIQGAFFGPDGSDGDLITFTPEADFDRPEGSIVVTEYDTGGGSETEVFDSKTNVVLDPGTNDLTHIISEDLSSCDSQPCQIAKTDFTYDPGDVDVSSCNSKSYSDNCVVGYRSGDKHYIPKNEIVAGEVYGEGGPPDSVHQKKFYFCAAIEGFIGKTVYSPGDNYEHDQFKCNYYGAWENVALCEDGVDNDEDGATDLNDPHCSSSTDGPEDGPSETCNPRIGRLANDYTDPDTGVQYDSYRKVAFHGSESVEYLDSESDCGYANFDPSVEYSNQPPELYTCLNTDYFGAIPEGYTGDTESEDIGNAVDPNGAEYYCNQLASFLSGSVWDNHQGLEVVEYFVARENIPIGSNKYATSDGFKNKFYDTLNRAESDYYKEVRVACDNEPNWQEPVAPECYSTEHNNDSYEPINLTDLSDGYTADEYMDSWTFANASVNNDKIGRPTNARLLSDEAVFDGGFAGKCTGGKRWMYREKEGGWKCSGALGWTFKYFVPDIDPVIPSETTVGVFLPKEIFDESTRSASSLSFTTAWYNRYNEKATIERVKLGCYPGSPKNPSDVSFDQVFDVPDSGVSETILVTEQVDLSQASSYSCTWGFVVEKSDGTLQTYFNMGNADKYKTPRKAREELGIGGFMPGRDITSDPDEKQSIEEADKQLLG